jgi:hypothetical protein
VPSEFCLGEGAPVEFDEREGEERPVSRGEGDIAEARKSKLNDVVDDLGRERRNRRRSWGECGLDEGPGESGDPDLIVTRRLKAERGSW